MPLLTIRKPDIIRRLLTKLGIEPSAAYFDLAMSPVIAMTTSVDTLLKIGKTGSAVKSLTAGAGALVPYATVPVGKRWTLIQAKRNSTTANSSVYLYIAGVQYTISADGTALEFVDLQRFILNEGDAIGMLTTGNGGDGAIGMGFIYEEEDAY